MAVVPTIAIRLFADSGEVLFLFIPAPEPRELLLVPLGFFPTVLLPLDFDTLTKDIRGSEGTDVHAYAVVQIRMPADGLFGEGLPANEEVIGRFAFENELEPGLQLLGSFEAGVTAGFAGLHSGLRRRIQSPR